VLGVETVRIDRWLWAARIFKTRSLAARACAAGHVRVAGEVVKPAKAVRAGDRLEVVAASGRRLVLEVVSLADRRGPAPEARVLYLDHSPPPSEDEQSAVARRDRGTGRPSKRERRAITRYRGR
jgi:ribosome-associated heat shock protein Hsp15